MENTFNLKQFLAEGKLLKEEFQNKNLLIINQGSDELGNMHGITASSEEDFVNQFQTMYNGGPEEFINDVVYLEIPTQDQLDKLYNMFNTITLIDHHLYPEEFFNSYSDKMKVHYDKSKCAALLTNEYFKNTGKNKDLDTLTKITDVYDLWQVENPLFDVSQNLNNFFWELGMDKFCSEIIRFNYTLPNYYPEVVKKINDKISEGIQKLEQKKLIHRFGKVTVVFTDEFFNDVLIREMMNGQDIVINAMAYGIIKVRISQYAPFSAEKKIELSRALSGVETTGHLNAFTYKMSIQTSFENIMNEIQRVIKVTYMICYVK